MQSIYSTYDSEYDYNNRYSTNESEVDGYSDAEEEYNDYHTDKETRNTGKPERHDNRDSEYSYAGSDYDNYNSKLWNTKHSTQRYSDYHSQRNSKYASQYNESWQDHGVDPYYESKNADPPAAKMTNNSPSTPSATFDSRFIYGCIPRNRTSRLICLSIVVVIVGILGILLYVLFPRIPKMTYIKGNFSKNNVTYDIPNDSSGKANLNLASASGIFQLGMSAKNVNLYAINIESLTFDVKLAVNRSRWDTFRDQASTAIPEEYVGQAPVSDPKYEPSLEPLIGKGLVKNLILAPNKDVPFEIAVKLLFSPDKKVGLLKDPMFFELYDACGLLDGEQRPIKINYYAKATLKGTGISYPMNHFVRIRCPVGTDKLMELRNKLTKSKKSMKDMMDEIKKLL